MGRKRRPKASAPPRRRPPTAGTDERGSPEDQPATTAPSANPSSRALTRVNQLAGALVRRLFPVYWWRRSLNREHAFHEARDLKSFQAARLPDGEEVQLRCVWIMEVFLASHVTALADRLRALGLDRLKWTPDSESAIDSLLRARVRGGGGWTVNLGYLVPRDQGKRSTGKPAVLPVGVASVFFAAVSTVPEATTIVAQFRFDDETASHIAEPFATRYRTTAVRRDGYITIPAGVHLRDEAVVEIRSMLRRRCERWMHENLPGAFAGLSDEAMPACELLTFVKGDPFGGREPPRWVGGEVKPVGRTTGEEQPRSRGFGDEDYLEILGQRGATDAWGCVDCPGLALRLPQSLGIEPRDDRLVFSAQISAIGKSPGEGDGTAEGVAVTTVWLSYTLGVFTLARLVGAFEATVARLRDRLGEVPLHRTRTAVAQMEEIERDLARLARDARPLLIGISSAPEWIWRREVFTFLPFDVERGDDGPLFTSMAKYLVERSRRLLATEEETRTTSHGISGLVAASANLSAARSNVRLQRIAIVIASLAALFSALAIPGVLNAVREAWPPQNAYHGTRAGDSARRVR